ncbi:MAG: O-methyltransferase [Gemmatimonadota bacterium]|nr:O-methyltransferase [Gemmatimonadota bacterium]MDH4351199.1 O-methyltransferase [Gemmatimonadota bacterium]MDH5196724.1 O-methyltransferase [Gemmatimonadota bacterium]
MTAEPSPLAEYLAAHFAPEDAALAAVRTGHRDADLPTIHISAAEGAILQMLIRLLGARRVLEVGTLGGYSGIWLARGLAPGGRLITIEGDEGHAAHARAAFERAGVADRVDLRCGEARDTMASLDGPFDAIFLDADKAPLPEYLDLSLRLLRVGGLLLCDNTFMDGRIADPDADGADLRGMREFNRRMAADRRFTTAVIPVRDGLLAAVRVAP